MPRSLILGLLAALGALSILLATACVRAGEGPSGRRAWRYVQGGLTVTFTHGGGTQWIAARSDGKRPVYDEVGRSVEYVELQNRETKLFVRLHADQAYWRRPRDERWTPWVKGGWVGAAAQPMPGPAPEDRPEGARIRLAYFVPRDRQPAAGYQQKLRVVMAIVGDLYLQDLRGKGYRTDGLRFETEGNQLAVHLVRGNREASYYNNAPVYSADEQWRRLGPELRAKAGDPPRQVVIVFVETYDSGPAEHLWPGVIARGAYNSTEGGLAVFSAHLLQDGFSATTVDAQRRLFFDQTPVPGRKAWGHPINSPRGEFVEDGVGAVAHELGHALGLPHDRRDDTRDLMGNGFRNLRWNFGDPSRRRVGFSEENARLLMSSRYLAADLDRTDDQPPQVQVSPPSGRPPDWAVTISASDNTGLRAIVIVDRGAGSVIAGRKLRGRAQRFRQPLPLKAAAARDVKLQVIVTDDGGNQTRISVGGPGGSSAVPAPGGPAG